MRLVFLGTGDAFGTGGRFQSCLHVSQAGAEILVDCGATSLVALKRSALKSGTLDGIVLTHLHGDHFAGLPFLLLEAQLASGRTRPLVVAGPAGTALRLQQCMEALFPGSSRLAWRFPFSVVEMSAGNRAIVAGFAITPFLVSHPSGAPAHALRIEAGGKVLACSGDTEWVETLVEAADGADVFVCECYSAGRNLPFHMHAGTLLLHLPRLAVRRLLVTHMGQDVLAATDLPLERAYDGMTVDL